MRPPKPDKPGRLHGHRISPVLIMLLVGSLSFFLVQVFIAAKRWAAFAGSSFWFVMAVVWCRGSASSRATAMPRFTDWRWQERPGFNPDAGATGLFGRAPCCWARSGGAAHKLTWDCTLIDEDEDAPAAGCCKPPGNSEIPR